jgi:hypothetical protein
MKKLNNSGGTPINIAEALENKGRNLHNGFLDEHDREAMRHDNAMRKMNNLRPTRLGQTRSGFGRPAYHPNASRVNPSLINA